MAAEREHDLVLLGATGFTGGLTADYLAANAPSELRWAIAGRNPQRLETMRERLAAIDGRWSELPLIAADVSDPASLERLAQATSVVATTVGPYLRHGEPLVAACAAAGTDYLDLTGEPEFVDRMWLAHHERARSTGARLIHACGFDSIPHDLGTLHCVEQLPEGVPLTVDGYVQGSGAFSGGTYHSAIVQFARARKLVGVARRRREAEPDPARESGRRVSGARPKPHRAAPPIDAWALPMPTIDPLIVLRSARALERYGPDFTYGHNLVVGTLPRAAGLTAGVSAAFALSQLPPTRALLLKLKNAGEGPSVERRERAWFKVTFVGEGGGRRVVTEVSGGDPGYSETAKMLAEAAICTALDDLPETAGQVTTAQALGWPLIERLERAGMGFATLSAD